MKKKKQSDNTTSAEEETDEERVAVLQLDLQHKKKVKAFQVEFRLLKMLSSRFPYLNLSSVVSSIERKCKKDGIDLYGYDKQIYGNFTLPAKVNHKIQECKAQIMKNGRDLMRSGFFTLDKTTMEYLDVLHCYMNVVVVEEFDEFASFKTVKEALFLLKHLIASTPQIWSGQENFADHCLSYVNCWSIKAERIILLSWRNEPEEKLRDFHLYCLSKDKADVPDLIRSCFKLIQDQKLRRSDSLIIWEFVSSVVGLVLEDVVSTLKVDVPVLREGLILLITFLADSSTNYTTMDHDSDLSYFQQKLHAVFETSMELSRGMTTVVEFRFLRILLLCRFPRLDSIVTTIEDMCNNERKYSETGHAHFTQWNSVTARVYDKILECMAKIKNDDKHLIQISLTADLFTLKETVKYLDVIHRQMNDLFEHRVDEFAHVKHHVKTLEETLFLLRYLIAFTPRSEQENFEKALHLEFYVHHWANKAVSMKLLSWLNEEQCEFRSLHLDNLHKADPFTPELIWLCFGLIKVQMLRRSDTLFFWKFVTRFVDFFLENVVFTLKDNDVPVLREGLIFLITFLAYPPTNTRDHSDLSSFVKKIHAVFYQASQIISYFGQTSMDLSIRKTNVVHLQESVDGVRREIERLYVRIDHPPWSNFPRTNGLEHFESLFVYLENLEETINKNEKVVPFIKHQIFTIKEELMPLRLLLQDIWNLKNHHEEVKGMCDQIISLSYQVDFAIKSSFFIDSIWYNLTSLSFIVEKIKDTQSKVMTIKDNHVYITEVVPPLISSFDVFNAPTSTSIVEVMVGFKHETEVLIDRLTRGTAKLDIVPIVGMGGIGKTTLAKKLFNETSIKYHFHKRAFCRVSQAYRKKNVLLDILSYLCAIDDEVCQMSDGELAHKLKKCLSGCKYLIVMDDIWDIKDWYDVLSSFPDDNNGSKVIFTTRMSNIYMKENSVSNSHMLPLLSVDESWELLRLKIFQNDPCPPHLCELGKLIAKKCRGLPLTIVVIAGLLKRTERSLFEWNKVADDLTNLASSEGCKDVIRLSYERLSEPLKSCFLYLGAFREDKKIKAKMLTKVWVAEGFVLKSGSNLCLRKIAKQYLNQLGETNLVIVSKRSSNGGIKHFYVHDLIRDFCRTEAQEQHYLCFVKSQNNKSLMPSVCDQYRVCIEDDWRYFVDSKPRGPTVHSLLHYSKDHCVSRSLESLLCNFKFVQVLDLQMQDEVDGTFPTAVTMLVHLRYLALRLHLFGTKKVPSEISNLWNLETLLILGIKVQFPCDIWKMKRLRHVETDDEAHVDLDKDASELPDLETFISLVIPPGKDGEELLRRLPNVRKLSCMFSGCSCFQIPKLDILTKLESLHIRYIGEGIFQYPCTFTIPLYIRKLTLESFELNWNEFTAIIRKLPALQVLVLRWTTSSKDSKIWDVQDEEFENIRSLTLEGLDIEDWKASTDSFPHIEKLKLSYCKHLIQIPPSFGEVQTLKQVLVRYCNNRLEASALQIHQDSDDQINLEVLHTIF